MQGKDKLEEILSEYFHNLMRHKFTVSRRVVRPKQEKTQNYARCLNDCDYCMRIMGNRR